MFSTYIQIGLLKYKLSKNSVPTLAMARESWQNIENFPTVLIIETVLIIFNDEDLS